MFSNLKSTISELAYAAVSMAEDTLKTASGQEKKAAAIEYIVSMLPVPSMLKGVINFAFSKVIDEAVEKAVMYMKNITNNQ